MDDLEAYLTRRPFQRFQNVLDEMKKEDVVGSLRRLGEDISKETSLSIAQGEFWSDTLDRWADNLVDPACNGQCKGQKSKKSLPPSLVLEAMRILEAEMALREETRVAEQAKTVDGEKVHAEKSQQLGKTQGSLDDRVIALAEKIAELPDGETEFDKELKLLEGVDLAMQDAEKHLVGGDTASRRSRHRPKRSSYCFARSGSIPRVVVAGEIRPEAAEKGQPVTRPSRCWVWGSMRRRFARIVRCSKRRERVVRSFPRNSRAGWTNTSAGLRNREVVDEMDGRRVPESTGGAVDSFGR